MTNFGSILDSYREAGVRTFAGGSFADRLEHDREFSEELFKDAGIEVPKSKTATSWSDAAKLATEADGPVALKPGGILSGVIPSYVASTTEDALAMLKQFEKRVGAGEIEITVQEVIDGVAVSTEGWFNGKEWVEGLFNHTIERKQFLNCDLGPSGGCTGNVVWPSNSKDPLVKELLLKLTEVLQKHLYVGPIDVNAIVNKKGVYALEFTPRFGYDAFPTLLYALADFNFGAFVDDLARGDNSNESLFPAFGAGIRLSLPPWPSEDFKHKGGVSILGLEEKDKMWFDPSGVMLVDEELQSAPGVGILGVVNGRGDTIGEAFARAYEIVDRIKAPGLQYRTDLAEVCLRDFRELGSYIFDEDESWIGVDLDGTLAEYSDWSNEIGIPIPKMISRVKRWISEDKNVRVLTARGSIKGKGEAAKYVQLCKIYDWIKEHVGEPIEVTDRKDPAMIRLYDDRVVQVVANEGELVK